MQVYKVKRNQNIFDVAVNTHGSIEGIFDLLINNPDLVKMGSKVGKEVFGDKFVLGEKPFLAGDNAAYYFRLVPGVRMVFFAEKENEENYPLHNGKFDFNEDIFPYAVCALYNVISTIE